MKVYIVTGEENIVLGLFTKKEDACASFPDEGEPEENELHDATLLPWSYWQREAAVYPDGTYEEWTREIVAHGDGFMEPCDDHLNVREEPWDGHTQSHCGEHICIYGTDRELIEVAFQEHLTKAIARQNGVCQSRHWPGDRADGRTTYETGFLKPVRRRLEMAHR